MLLSIKPDTDKQHFDSASHQKTEKEEDMELGEADVEEDVVELRKEMKGVHDHISLCTSMTFSELKRDVIIHFMIIINKK